MTTARSPVAAIAAQAGKIAATLKAAERGDPITSRFAEKIEQARTRAAFKVAIVMDDKIITVELPWATICNASEADLAAFIVEQMQRGLDQ